MTTINKIRTNGLDHWSTESCVFPDSQLRKVYETPWHISRAKDIRSAKRENRTISPVPELWTRLFRALRREGRQKASEEIRLIFTCLASRAIHIEALDDLSTDSFISGLRCLIALRGVVRLVRCDRGTNFVGADNELKRAMKELDSKSITAKMLSAQCEFQFNPPSSSHMGGVWERQIRTVRNVLSGSIKYFAEHLIVSDTTL